MRASKAQREAQYLAYGQARQRRRRITSAHHKSISAASRVHLKYAFPETNQGTSGKSAKPSQILIAMRTG